MQLSLQVGERAAGFVQLSLQGERKLPDLCSFIFKVGERAAPFVQLYLKSHPEFLRSLPVTELLPFPPCMSKGSSAEPNRGPVSNIMSRDWVDLGNHREYVIPTSLS